MYISKIVIINPYLYRKELNDGNNMHGLIMSLFEDISYYSATPRSDLKILWRLEQPSNSYPYLIVQHEKEITKTDNSSLKIETKTLHKLWNQLLRENEHISLQTLIRPTKKSSGKEVTLRTELEIKEHLLKHFKKHGLNIDPNQIVIELSAVKIKSRKILAVNVKTRGYIFDVESFRKLLINGLGHSKNYGFGLIQIGKY